MLCLFNDRRKSWVRMKGLEVGIAAQLFGLAIALFDRDRKLIEGFVGLSKCGEGGGQVISNDSHGHTFGLCCLERVESLFMLAQALVANAETIPHAAIVGLTVGELQVEGLRLGPIFCLIGSLGCRAYRVGRTLRI